MDAFPLKQVFQKSRKNTYKAFQITNSSVLRQIIYYLEYLVCDTACQRTEQAHRADFKLQISLHI